MRELVLIVLLVVVADALTSDARQYATRIFPILDPVTGERREAHPPGRSRPSAWDMPPPADPSPLVPWQPVAPAVTLTGKDFNWVGPAVTLTGKDFNWVVPQDYRVKIIPK